MEALDIIHNEHRALSAILESFSFVLDSIRDGRLRVDFKLLSAMIDYISQVPDKLHHPKEDDYLFAKIRERVPYAKTIVDKLSLQHLEGMHRMRNLMMSFIHFQAVGESNFHQFECTARDYLAFYWEHLNTEESELFPLARNYLSKTDWNEINIAFSKNVDPWSGEAGEFQSLFSYIVNKVPTPYGVGDPT